MADTATYLILLPLLAGIVLFIFPERVKMLKGLISLISSIAALYFSILIFMDAPGKIDLLSNSYATGSAVNDIFYDNTLFHLNIDYLAGLIGLFVCIFAVLINIYAITYITKKKIIRNFYPYFLLTLGCSVGAVFSDNFILFIFFWGLLGLTLYKLIKSDAPENSATAKKSLILIGASDSLMIFGIGVLWLVSGSLTMSGMQVATNTALTNIAFICLIIGSFTKAGAFPFHSWIPDYAKDAPATSSAYLPASLDKLLGIYFMYRLCMNIFDLNQWLTLALLIIGVATIIIAVMMALVQHNYKKLLGYHAVSQVGYMVTGLGLGTPLGIAGGLFHMINHALYKSGLLLSAGSVERQTGEDDLEKLGGLSKAMPLSFIAALVFALSISGIPPLNGFASKWMIYQGIIDFGKIPGVANNLWILWLALAVLGSALTLASFIKFISGIYLGQKTEIAQTVKEVPVTMWFPKIILALTCIAFGVFATNYVIPKIIMPVTGSFEYFGAWDSTLLSVLVLISVLLGFIMYLAGNPKNFRTEDSFIGGEVFREKTAFPVTNFYKTLSEFPLFSFFYKKAEKKWFDIYDVSKRIVFLINDGLRFCHTGTLPLYSIWLLAGLIVMFIILI